MLVLLSVILIAGEIDAPMDVTIATKLTCFGGIILSAIKLRKYRDVMDKDIEKLEGMMDIRDDENEDDD